MYQLGGMVINLTSSDSQLGRSEPIEDTARVVSRMVDLVMIRTFGQERLERFAHHSRVPVINGLTNEYHPCQILADVLTYIEKRGDIEGKIVTWIVAVVLSIRIGKGLIQALGVQIRGIGGHLVL